MTADSCCFARFHVKFMCRAYGGQVEKTHKTPRPPDKGDDVQIHRQVTEQKTARAMTPTRSEKEDKYDRIIRTNSLFRIKPIRLSNVSINQPFVENAGHVPISV